MLSSFWEGFLNYLEKNEHASSVVRSFLRQSRPSEMTETKIVVACPNHSLLNFLDKRRPEIEGALKAHVGKNMSVELVVSEQKKKKLGPAPLLDFQPSAGDLAVRSGLHIKYSFDNFAVSLSNQVAYAAALAVSQNIGVAYNPLFLYGGVGVGKTHLAQAVARRVIEKDREKRVFFCPGDQFTNELIESIREKSTPRFRRKYRGLHLLVVDDVQFIAGKHTVQEEIFHTFNSVVSGGGQIILTSDRPPAEIRDLEDRLRSRFSGGLIVDVQEPDFELRTAILLIKAKEKNIEIDMDAAKIIAEQTSDTRALEGALLSIYAKTLGKKEKVDLEAAADFFQDKEKHAIKKIAPGDVIKAVCSYYNVKQSHLKGSVRTDRLALPRQITMYILRRNLRMKLDEVAYLLKKKDHTTVIHAVEKVGRLLAKDRLFKEEVDRITKSIGI